MLSRGLFDHLALWPAVFWPIFYSSCFWAFIRLCQILQQRHGFSPLNGRRKTDLATKFVILPLATIVEVVTHSYMFYVVGYPYLVVAIPIYIFGWVLLPTLLDGFRPAMTVLALGHGTFALSFAVLLGFWDLKVLRALNSDIYGLLVGVPTNL